MAARISTAEEGTMHEAEESEGGTWGGAGLQVEDSPLPWAQHR